ncbi:MAG TPA: IS1595 family transposase [Candidatus Binataceae bacterium]|nr:IS1595 family transposase [Candidatus Binataceae bacterium]
MARSVQPRTLHEALAYFGDEGRCVEFAAALRWPDGVRCPSCGSGEVMFLATRRIWKCRNAHPRQQFSVKAGTLFEDSPIGLDKWFAVIWMIANQAQAPTSYEVARELGVTQKTGWFILHRIRLAIESGSFEFPGETVINLPREAAGFSREERTR